jgi:hypothetical protein
MESSRRTVFPTAMRSLPDSAALAIASRIWVVAAQMMTLSLRSKTDRRNFTGVGWMSRKTPRGLRCFIPELGDIEQAVSKTTSKLRSRWARSMLLLFIVAVRQLGRCLSFP